MGELQAADVIPVNLIRSLIQDRPKADTFLFTTDGQRRIFNVDNFPVIQNSANPFTLEINYQEITTGYTLYHDSGVIHFTNPPEYGEGTVHYYYAQLLDTEIIEALDAALLRHDPSVSWDNFPAEYSPYIQWLAGASCYYMLASRWATMMRLKVETVETHDHQVSGRYFDLARRMEDRYYEACAGIIQVAEVTRRDVRTGLLVPIAEEFYNE